MKSLGKFETYLPEDDESNDLLKELKLHRVIFYKNEKGEDLYTDVRPHLTAGKLLVNVDEKNRVRWAGPSPDGLGGGDGLRMFEVDFIPVDEAIGKVLNESNGQLEDADLHLTFEERKAKLDEYVEDLIDQKAKELGYKSIDTAISYAEEPAVKKFQDEGRALRAWRSMVYAKCYEILDDVVNSKREEPTKEELVKELPKFVKP